METKKLGVGISGAGDVAAAHVASWKQNPHIEIISIMNPHKEKAQRLIDRFDLQATACEEFDTLLDDDRIDILDIAGPNQVHTEQGIAAVERGKHIMVEKPSVLTMAENRALRDAVAKAGVKSIVGFVLRWNPLFDILKSLVAEGALGDLFYAGVDYWHGIGTWYNGRKWGAHTKEMGGSTYLLGGCHAIDALRWFTGDEVVEVSAMGNNQKGLYEYDANVVASLKFKNGTVGRTSTLFDAEMPYCFNIDLAGTEGTLRNNRFWSKRNFPGQTDWTVIPTILPDSGAVDHHPFDAEIDHFVECILENRESHCNVADTYNTHEICIAIDRSLELGGAVVKLPLE